MIVVLVTGLMGAGKSSVISFLESKKHSVFRADKEAKKFLSSQKPCYPQLKQVFSGQDVFSSSTEGFDKKKLAKVIFENTKLRKAMEKIIHPLVQKSLQLFLKNEKKKGKKIVFYEAPLISKGLLSAFDKHLLVSSSLRNRKKRLLERGWTVQEISARWRSQISEDDIKDKVDFIIHNNGNLENLEKEADKILCLLSKI